MRQGLLTMAAVVVGSGVAFAATIVGTNRADTRSGGASGDPALNGAPGNDNIEGGSDADVLSGGNGGDGISGGAFVAAGANELYGGPGADTITADMPAAFDEVYGGSGDDLIFAEDDIPDFIECGVYASPNSVFLDDDTVFADRVSDGDPVSDILFNCETVN